MFIEREASLKPSPEGLNLTVNVDELLPLIVEAGWLVMVKSAEFVPETDTALVPRVNKAVPEFSIVNVFSIKLLPSVKTDPRCVFSNNDGTVDPSAISIELLDKTAISTNSPKPSISKLYELSSASLLVMVKVAVLVPPAEGSNSQ